MEHRYLLTTIQKAFDVLSLFREHEKLSFTDIQMNLGFSKATLFRILYTLEKNKYLTKDENGRYSLGVSVFILANRYSLGSYIRRVFVPYLKELANKLNLAVHLGVLEGVDVVILWKEDPPRGLKMVSRIGKTVPAHCTGQGKVLLAFSPRDRVESVINAHGLRRYTCNTITTVDALYKELETIRDRGYAIDNSEHEDHIKCVAVPILDCEGNVQAALSVTGLVMDLATDETVKSILTILKQVVFKGRQELGFC